MKRLISIVFLVGCANMVCSLLIPDVFSIVDAMKVTLPLVVEYGFNGYNPDLTADQVIHLACAKPSDKVFNTVALNDTNMATKLDLTKPIGFLTHGWVDNGYSKWMSELSQAWVDNHDTNVCRVDWSMYSLVEYSVAARRNVKLVGKHIAAFIKMLHDSYGLSYADVTLIGHSLGGQITGIVGYNLGGQIGRIIAMDPAGPLFTMPIKVPLEDQLDKTDAVFVTVVHSNDYLLGVGYSIGHADYYPNGGPTIQPGCIWPLLFGVYAIEIEPLSCSHFRSIRFVHLSMLLGNECLGIKCNTKLNYVSKQCTNTTDTWGVDSAKIEGDFYFWSGLNPKCTKLFWGS